MQDGDAIFARAITIASPQERDAYVAQACGSDVALRRQVEERVAAHFQSGQAATEAAASAANGTIPPRPETAPAVPAPVHHGQHPPHTAATAPQTHSSGLLRVVGLLVLALGVVAIAAIIWAMRAHSAAEEARHEAEKAREHAQKAEEESEHRVAQVEAARKDVAEKRDQAVEEEKAARESAADMKAALAFFQLKVLSAGRPREWSGGPVGWTGGMGKNVTLRKAVDAAEPKVAEAFTNRPLAEAALREVLGSTYVDLEEAELGVKQYERALALREAYQGEENPDTVACRNQLAVAYRLANRPVEASRLYEPSNPSSTHAAALVIRGVLLLSHNKPTEAEKLLRESVAISAKIQPDSWTIFEARSLLGEALLEQKKYDDAEPLLRSGYEGLKEHASKIPSQANVRITRAVARLVHLYDGWGKKDKAAQWRKELEETKRKEP